MPSGKRRFIVWTSSAASFVYAGYFNSMAVSVIRGGWATLTWKRFERASPRREIVLEVLAAVRHKVVEVGRVLTLQQHVFPTQALEPNVKLPAVGNLAGHGCLEADRLALVYDEVAAHALDRGPRRIHRRASGVDHAMGQNAKALRLPEAEGHDYGQDRRGGRQGRGATGGCRRSAKSRSFGALRGLAAHCFNQLRRRSIKWSIAVLELNARNQQATGAGAGLLHPKRNSTGR